LIPEKLYGFIIRPAADDVFFHRSDLKDPTDWPRLTEGSPVTFVLAAADQGKWRATLIVRD
jgi:cold shock CspA family protein